MHAIHMAKFESYMYRCLQLAQLGEYYVAPNPMVGAVLVYDRPKLFSSEVPEKTELILGEGWHQQ